MTTPAPFTTWFDLREMARAQDWDGLRARLAAIAPGDLVPQPLTQEAVRLCAMAGQHEIVAEFVARGFSFTASAARTLVEDIAGKVRQTDMRAHDQALKNALAGAAAHEDFLVNYFAREGKGRELLLLHRAGVDIVRGGETMFAGYCALREETMSVARQCGSPIYDARIIAETGKPAHIADDLKRARMLAHWHNFLRDDADGQQQMARLARRRFDGQLRAQDVLAVDPKTGASVLAVQAAWGRAQEIFEPRCWLEHPAEAMAVYDALAPLAAQGQVDIEAFSAGLTRLRLAQARGAEAKRGNRFRL